MKPERTSKLIAVPPGGMLKGGGFCSPSAWVSPRPCLFPPACQTHLQNCRLLVNRPEILRELNSNAGLTIVMVTHDPGLGRLGGRHIEMRDGRAYEG